MIARLAARNPFKVSRRESRVQNMEPDSITEVDTKKRKPCRMNMGIRKRRYRIPHRHDPGRPLCDQTSWGLAGFGVVYLASDEKVLSRLVVVKVLLDEKISHKWSVRNSNRKWKPWPS
jgi:hypothetical protein